MKVRHDRDEYTGLWYREIIYKSHKRLSQLKHEYELKGYKTWLNYWGGLADEWILTVEMGENYGK